MGVRGLRTYLESKELLLEHRLQSVNLIIDGNNLVYYLNHYIQHCIQNDHMYGGDYMVSSEQLRCLFGKFSKCNIKPIIVFDGSIDPNMQKLSVTLERHLNKHRISHKIYQNNFLIEGLKPLLFKEIFIKEAENASFPIIQVMHEADHFIIEIANELNSPILSNDSDFLIYNLPAGVIIADTLRFDQPLSKDQNQHYYINCKIYHISDLKRHHPKLNLNLVQIIGFLLGNDYVNICERIPFLKQIKQSKNNKNIFGKTLRWISSFNDLQSLLIKLSIIFNSEHHQIIKLIKMHFLTLKSVDDGLKNGLINVQSQSFNSDNHLLDYLDRKKQTIIRQMKFPEILGHAYVDAKISSRIISIRNFPYDIWIEFIYAIYLNLWFGDYLFPIECSMRFLSFKSSDDDNLVHKIENNLRRFYQLPKLSHSKLFIPRIVHFYNCFQVCLEDIKLASKILLVNQLFDFDSMIDRLSGIFIYNLTVELSSRSQPLLYIQELLLRDQFYPMKIFIDLLQFIMVQSERNFLLKSRKFFDNIVPSSLPSIDASALNESDNNSKQSLLVRGFEVTNRQTHINSQRLKIHKKGQSRL
ncbi:DNA excision repair protein [Sarcoptes scabiei]|nr:DNA excision repair protein [Sarcoptes scabiei]